MATSVPSPRGVTLVELLVALALLTALFRLALPAFNDLIAREQATAALNRMLGLVAQARASAVRQNRALVLCASDSTEADAPCAGRDDWHLGTLLFADRNGDGRYAIGERAVRRDSGWSGPARVRWRSFRNRSYLRFRPNGMTDWQNGSFTWCPDDRDASLAVQLVLNAGGRARKARDQDGDGIAEDSQGRPLAC
jgi:type IV fimbrial biogenesis protein FimT